jgi:glycosyltransferase involved in cell wall biosynthesis
MPIGPYPRGRRETILMARAAPAHEGDNKGKTPRVLVAIPADGEEKSIGGIVSSIRRKLPYDIVVVNDGSPDGTSAVARAAGAVTLDLPCNLGIGGALQTAYQFARDHGYDTLVRIDADGQHEVEDIPIVLDPVLRGNADAVIGSRFLGKKEYRIPIPRIFGIRFFRWLVRWNTGYRVTDPTSGFFAINRHLIEFYSHHYPSDYPEVDAYIIMHRLKARTMEVPVRMYERTEGKSSITTYRAVYYMVKVTLSFFINRIRRLG